MAKFENHLKSSSLTWGDLETATNNKIDSYETLYESYSNAYAANDTKLVNKYDRQLDKIDAEILAMIKKQESSAAAPAADPTPAVEKPAAASAADPTPAVEKPKGEGFVKFWWQ